MKKSARVLAGVLALLLLLSLGAGCSRTDRRTGDASGLLPGGGQSAAPTGEPGQYPAGEPGSWAIYWYLCGSDLESGGGFATSDLREMMEVDLPENVTVVVQTGGAAQWQNRAVDPDAIQRFVYSSDSRMELVDTQPLSSMGSSETLADFLSFCLENYPAEHKAVIFWNHGGGSASGVAFDELYGYDSLTLDEFYAGFAAACTPDLDAPPFDLVGFDACLMATVDTAYTLCDISRYMVASEEMEPGNGWDYTGIFSALAADPGQDVEDLGRAVCDSFYAANEAQGWESGVTLSLVDLQAVGPLVLAYDQLGTAALAQASADPIFLSSFGRCAMESENYGGNTDDQGYTNMVDLGDLVRNASGLLPEEAAAVLSALEDCVVYQVKGSYRSKASGLSCYYSFSGDSSDLASWAEVAASPAFCHLYSYELEGEMDQAGLEYLEDQGYTVETAPQEVPDLDALGLDNAPLQLTEDGYAILDIGPEAAQLLKAVYFDLIYIDQEQDVMLFLGMDNDLYADWENGRFQDNFRGVWGTLDGHVVYMEIVDSASYYNTYNVPILLNGEKYNLRVVYDFNQGRYQILGARKAVDNDSGMADRAMIQLQDGDVITTLHYGCSLTGDDEAREFEGETFVIDGTPVFTEEWMGDGLYAYGFDMVGMKDETYLSDIVFFTVDGDDIILEDF